MRIGVVGAGVFGLAAAIEAAARGHRVSVFEQGAIPHPAASSTDVAKGMRRMWYASDNETYVELAEQAGVQWRAWEQRSGDRFFHQVGSLRGAADFSAGSPMRASADFLIDRGAEIAVLSAKEAGKRFPQLRFAAGEVCVYDPWAGYIESARAIAVMAGIARESGCRMYPSTPVTGVEERASGVEVAYRGERDRFDRVVVAAGPWVGRLLPAVGAKVRVTRQQMLLIEPPDRQVFAGDRLPVWMIDDDGAGWYGFPLLRGGYAKIARDRLGEAVDPDVERAGTADFRLDAIEFMQRRLPELAAGMVVEGRSCLYTNTPDDHFLVDRVPGTERIFVAGGGSGHGFKFGGALGPVIVDAVEERPNPLGDRFRIGNRLAAARTAGTDHARGYAQPPPA
ncbi:MAG: FAD-dependent oxidoreductase [Spirochaetaceae bacterium]|nr:FAD-dependent oxidoreductase [Spirochaetaceae bacterium]